MKITKFCPINIEYNEWNGLMISVLTIEAETATASFNGALFGLYIHQRVSVELFFVWMDIKSPFHW